jgi:hypothetical protein
MNLGGKLIFFVFHINCALWKLRFKYYAIFFNNKCAKYLVELYQVETFCFQYEFVVRNNLCVFVLLNVPVWVKV